MANYNRKWADAELAEAVRTSRSRTEVLRKLRLSPSGQNMSSIDKHIERLELDTTHFVRHGNCTQAVALDDILVEGSSYYGGSWKIKKKLIDAGRLPNRCMMGGCPNPEPIWNGQPLTLQLDHINGNHSDNRIENLRVLCPNCHTQTDTWGGKR